MDIPSKQTIVEVASTSGDRDILYCYVANENDHTVLINLVFDEGVTDGPTDRWTDGRSDPVIEM